MKKPKFENFPFKEVIRQVDLIIGKGEAEVYQKFTCAGCGQRLTIDVPDTFYKEGKCDKCDATTNIEKDGCNYMLIQRMKHD